MGFHIGEAVVHPRYGAGKTIGERTLLRDGEQRVYLCIELVHGRGTLLLPLDRVEETDLRVAVTDFRVIGEVLNESPEILSDHHRTRQMAVEKLLRSGMPHDSAQALRDLAWREATDRLTGTDSRLKDTAFKQLADELALNSHINRVEAGEQLTHLLSDAIQHHLVEVAASHPTPPDNA